MWNLEYRKLQIWTALVAPVSNDSMFHFSSRQEEKKKKKKQRDDFVGRYYNKQPVLSKTANRGERAVPVNLIYFDACTRQQKLNVISWINNNRMAERVTTFWSVHIAVESKYSARDVLSLISGMRRAGAACILLGSWDAVDTVNYIIRRTQGISPVRSAKWIRCAQLPVKMSGRAVYSGT